MSGEWYNHKLLGNQGLNNRISRVEEQGQRQTNLWDGPRLRRLATLKHTKKRVSKHKARSAMKKYIYKKRKEKRAKYLVSASSVVNQNLGGLPNNLLKKYL